MKYDRVSLESFSEHFQNFTELQSVAIGGEVTAVSDEFFAGAHHLLLVEPAPSLKGQFNDNGAVYSGWESRRHNPAFDWCIIKLGTSGFIHGFDVDTSHFNGNEAPEVSIEGLLVEDGEAPPKVDDPRWSEILPKVPLGPSSRHLFKLEQTITRTNYVKLNMYPDGGIARFRVYGSVAPVHPKDLGENFDLAHVFAGGQVVFTSDQHFGVGSNLILPGRGKDMGDGWETKRSRQKGHKDWAIIKLGTPGYLQTTEIDTAHFKGNFPESCQVHAVNAQDKTLNWGDDASIEWVEILPRTKLGPHRQHFFQLENVHGQIYTHVKVTIHPDGGIKRIRIIGRQAADAKPTEAPAEAAEEQPPTALKKDLGTRLTIPALPLTPEAFAPFGKVIQAYLDNSAPRNTRITPANNGTATKYHKLALLESSYPPESGATSGFSVYRCNPSRLDTPGLVPINMLERHACTNQAFIPMSSGGSDSLKDPGNSYIVVVAKNGADDKPDIKTLRAFYAGGGQGIVYDTAVWHLPMTVLGKPIDFACVETQIGDGSEVDCEIVGVEAEVVADVTKYV